MSEKQQPDDNTFAAEKVRSFPHAPGIYLMKDAAGRVIYVGKAKSLRSRAGSYFLKAAAEDQRTARLVQEIRDIDYLEAESEIDALLMEARLIKDILPKFNRDLRDSKTFPYLEIDVREDYPRVRFTREPRGRDTKLYGPFTDPRQLRGAIQVLQKIFKFRTCDLDIDADDKRWQWFRPCLLHAIGQCTAPCNLRISQEDYRKDIKRLQAVLEGKKKVLLAEMRDEMAAAAKELRFEEAGRLRDEIEMLESLDKRGALSKHVQPEVFPIDPKKGLTGLQKVLHLPNAPRTVEGVDIAHTAGTETVASIVQFIDGLPFKPGYKRMRIRGVEGVDDYASIYEAVARRFAHLRDDLMATPDILLIDGGKGQLDAALAAIASHGIEPPLVLSLAKREELVYVMNREGPLRLSRHSYALRLLQYVRDEAHRFAQHYHHILRKRTTLGDAE
jgi:excinuclease ABC subunit C